MINEEESRSIFERWLKDRESERTRIQLWGLVPLYEFTVTKLCGWVYFWQSRRYWKTKERLYMLLGNAPVLVTKEDGSLVPRGTAFDVAHYLREYEKGRLF